MLAREVAVGGTVGVVLTVEKGWRDGCWGERQGRTTDELADSTAVRVAGEGEIRAAIRMTTHATGKQGQW